MKNLILILVIALLASSCCPATYCTMNKNIEFRGFHSDELDSVYVRKIDRITNTTIDSTIYEVHYYTADPVGYIYTNDWLELDYKYALKTANTDSTYILDDFFIEKGTCGKGICQQTLNSLASYKVNGSQQLGGIIYISK